MSTNKPAILAIDQGTTSSRAIVFDCQNNVVSVAQQEFPQLFPADGWVEHDPEAIWETTRATCQQALKQAESLNVDVKSIGITNQRETTVVWHRKSGKPIYNAIVWQDRRTAERCDQLNTDPAIIEHVRRTSGLLLDPYFSATKVAWILDHVEGARTLAAQGELCFGTIDSFLIWRLTGGKVHATDVTNASRTNLFNIHTRQWDDTLLNLFNVPDTLLPDVKQCADDFGVTDSALFGKSIPIGGVAGDQQAALIGQRCFNEGQIKSTYGTGCFALINTGEKALTSNHQLLTTIAYSINGVTHYALEGSIFIAGAAVQWLRDGMKLLENAKQSQAMIESLPSNEGVYMVTAFTGLGAPHWNPHARGAVFGLTRDTQAAHFVRAAVESVCYQTQDLINAMQQDGINASTIAVDGGMVANDWLCQCLADTTDLGIARPSVLETTALGAAYLAGVSAGLFEHLVSQDEAQTRTMQQFTPKEAAEARQQRLTGWRRAVNATLTFCDENA